MGTRYDEGDTVILVEGRYAGEKAEVVGIQEPESDSPIYEVRFLDNSIDVGINYHRASELQKVESDYPSPEELAADLKTAASQSGDVLANQPKIPGWQTVKPDPSDKEVFVVKNEDLGILGLRVRYSEDGSFDGADPTGGEQWLVEYYDKTGRYNLGTGYEQTFFEDRDEAYLEMANIMLDVTKQRGGR
jgi:hypothetical protein